MLSGEKKLYKQTCALKRGEAKLPPPIEQLRMRLEQRLGIRIVNIVYDQIDIGPAKGKPRLNVIVDTQSDLQRVRTNLFDFEPEACEAIFYEFRMVAMTAGWDSQRPHLISDDFSDEAMNQAAFLVLKNDREKIVEQYAAHEVWSIEGMSKVLVVFFKDEAAKSKALSSGVAERIKKSCFDAMKSHDEFNYLTRENFSLIFDSKENLDANFQGSLFYYFR